MNRPDARHHPRRLRLRENGPRGPRGPRAARPTVSARVLGGAAR